MGRLQDKQYAPTFQKKSKETADTETELEKEKLQAAFCPPIDSSLIEAIWNDTSDYQTSFAILSELAKEASAALDKELEDSNNVLSTSYSATSSSLSFQSQNEDEESDPSIEFLLTCFPGYERSELTRILKTQGDDVEKTTDLLLNTIFLENEHVDEPYRNDLNEKKKKRSAKKKNRNAKTVIWSSGALPIGTGSKQTEEENDAQEFNELAVIPFNYWHQYDHQVDKVQKVFPKMAKTRIIGSIQRFKGNIIATIRDLALKEPAMKATVEFCGWQAVRDLEAVQNGIAAVAVDRTPEVIHSVAVGVIVESNSQWPVEKMVQQAIEFLLTYDRQQELLAERLEKMLLATEQAFAAQKDIPVIPEYLLIDNRDQYKDDDPEECRAIAMSLIMERNELFRKAAAAYQRSKNKGPGEGGVAFFYSDEHNDDHLLDLHGLTVAEARVLLKEGITQWWSRSQMQSARRQVKPLKVITGIGKHSPHGQSRLLPSVLQWLKKDGWLIEAVNPGSILVKGLAKK
ncbi:hypothetical protein EC973_003247 [Apophysomyces ossiformis]|uniref:Smr domain-containing protein n=1 Tax=Apophysomyces ossiformis TaxID=679940 RepID=A0A8H7BW33_9FUNG|nr:hypothetical protein EC973_003247 [Apophysomyces ossiformis]